MIKHYLCATNQPTKLLIMKLLRRKIDKYLKNWKEDENRMPLIVKGARQVGKTASIMQFAYDNYKNMVLSYAIRISVLMVSFILFHTF